MSLPIESQMNIQMSKAELRRFCLFPSTKYDKDFIKIERVFSLNPITEDPIFSIKTAKSLIESSAIAEFLSQQYSEATKFYKKIYLWSWFHIHSSKKTMSKLIVLRLSCNRYLLMLFWWGLVRKHVQLSKHWYFALHQIILWWASICFLPIMFYQC